MKKNSVEIRLIFEKKFENNFWKKSPLKCWLISVNRWLIGTSVKISVDLGYFRLKHRLHNLPGLFQIHVSISFQLFLIFNLIRIDFFIIFYFYSSYLGKKSPRFITYKKRSKRSAKCWKVLQDFFDRFAVVFRTLVSGGFSSARPRCRSWARRSWRATWCNV